ALIRSCNNYLLDPPASLEGVCTYLATHPEESSLVKLAGLDVLAASAGVPSAKGAGWVLALLGDKEPELRLSVLRAVEGMRLTAAVPKVGGLLRNGGMSPPERQAAIRALGVLKDRSVVPVLCELLASSTEEEATRTEALRALATLDPKRAAD